MSLLVKLAHKGVDEFAEKYATNLSPGGMFIRSREPQPIGTLVRFKVEIAGGTRVLQGAATVRWVRDATDPSGPPGMGLQFTSLDEASDALVRRMLAGGSTAPVASIAPPPAIAPLTPVPQIAPVARPAPRSPSPKPAPAPPPPARAKRPDDDLPFKLEPGQSAGDDEDDEGIPLDLEAALGELPLRAGADEPVDFDALVDSVDAAAQPPPAEIDVDIDVGALIDATPEPDREAFEVDVDLAAPAPLVDELSLDIDLETPVEPPPAPPPPAPPTAAPTIAKGPAAAPRASRPPPGRPVFLEPPETIVATGPVVGIDLGTTNSACAVLSRGKPQILNSKDGYNTIPSVVALDKAGKLVVGHRANALRLLNPRRSIYGAKRLVGRDYESQAVRDVRERFHYTVVSGVDGRAAVELGDHVLALEEVQGIILRECKQMAEQHLGQPVSRAVITCPAYYSEQQREAVRRAAEMAGLKVERVLNEPTAAALAYGLNRGLTKRVLVYDLGGGTFDATVMRIDNNAFEVLATGGDIFLGGMDFDNQVVDVLLARFQAQHGRPFAGDAVALSRVSDQAERSKIALSERATVEVHLPMLDLGPGGVPLDLKCALTREDVNGACSALVDRTIDVVRDVLLDAALKPADLDDVILVGGMSRMPLVRERIKALFKKAPQASVNADEAVALGAALFAGTVDKISSVALIDVVPMTIGFGLPGGGFRRLIERNTPLPAAKSFRLATSRDDEQTIELSVFQGEDPELSGNDYVGTVRLEGLPRGPKGAVQLAVNLSLDPECVLHVEARELSTRKVVTSTLATRYTPDEVRRKLGVAAAKPPSAEQGRRAAELQQRGGRFWGFLKRVVGR